MAAQADLPEAAVRLAQIDRETLAAVLAGNRTTSEVGAALHLSSKSSVHDRLYRCRDAGLVNFNEGQQGTLRPVFRIVWTP